MERKSSGERTVMQPENPTCQHHRIDNATWLCLNPECGEKMISQICDFETVLDADNLVACFNPACVASLKDGTYDETDPPAGCTNPRGIYVPNRSTARTVVVGCRYTYKCERCANNATQMTFDRRGVTWSCGGVHDGEEDCT
jgi:hypothetical protein